MAPARSPSPSRQRGAKTSRSGRWSAGLVEIATAAALNALLAGSAGAVACSVATAPVNFGVYDPLSAAPNTSSGYIDVRCTCSGTLDCVAFSYTLSIPAGASGNVSRRTMTSPATSTPLAYNLYKDSANTIVLGTGSASVSLTYTLILFRSYQRTYVFGQAPARQAVQPGAYSDSLPITIAF